MNNLRLNKLVIWSTILIGVILRLRQFIEQRSLWLDEAMISINIIEKNMLELHGKLLYHQAAPLGFLYINKFFVSLLGDSELSLRLFPMLCGIAALYLLYQTAILINGKSFAVWPLLMIALSNTLIYYSNEVKQYMPDMLFAIIVTYLFVKLSKNIKQINLLYSGLIFSILVWFSHPLIFTIASGLLFLLLNEYQNTKKIQIKNTLIVAVPVFISFLLMYFINIDTFSGSQYLNEYWAHAFPKVFSSSINDLQNSVLLFTGIFPFPLGLHIIPLAVIVFTGGIFFCWKKNQPFFLLLVLPIFFTFTASCLGMYPFTDRFLIFLAPSVALLMGYFIDFLFIGNLVRKIAAIAVIAVLLFSGTRITAYFFINPQQKEELKDVMTYVKNNSSGKEGLYIYYSAIPAFRYYDLKIPIMNSGKVLWGSRNRVENKKYFKEIDEFQQSGEEIWFIMSHYHKNEKELIINHLKNSGELRDSVVLMGSSAFLYYHP